MGEQATYPRPEPLWRELVGAQLRRERLAREERLVDVARTAGVSTQYLSEVERGLKDASSEVLAAVAGALGLSVRDVGLRAAASAVRLVPLDLRAVVSTGSTSKVGSTSGVSARAMLSVAA